MIMVDKNSLSDLQAQVQQEIMDNFHEKFPNTQIIYMCETGSRGRNLANQSSDFDIGIIFLPEVERLYSTSRGNQAHHYKFNDQIDVTAYDLEKLMTLFKRNKPAIWEWFFSQTVYTNLNNSYREKLQNLYIDFYEKGVMQNHHARVGLGGGRTKRKRQFKFKRLLWSYLSLEGILRNDVFIFDYQSVLDEVLKEDTEYADIIRVHLDDKNRMLSPHEIEVFRDYFDNLKLEKFSITHSKYKKTKAIDKLMFDIYNDYIL